MTKRIGYCGKKEREVDHFAGTGLVWHPGVVHEVPDGAAVKLLEHPDVYVDVGDDTTAGDDDVSADKLAAMTKAELVAFASSEGIDIDGRAKADTIRDAIAAALAEG